MNALQEAANSLMSIHHHINLLTILILPLLAKLNRSKFSSILAKTFRIILSLLALCEDELDILSQIDIDIRALRLEDHPPLEIYPTKNRIINNLDDNFAYQFT